MYNYYKVVMRVLVSVCPADDNDENITSYSRFENTLRNKVIF